jgi:hypothetical protein
MPEYRVFPIDANNRIVGPSTIVTCDNDTEAIEEAKPLVDGHDVEVWQAIRLVAVITKAGQQKPKA